MVMLLNLPRIRYLGSFSNALGITSWRGLPDKQYHAGAEGAYEPESAETEQSEERSDAPGLEKIDGHDDGPREINERIVVITEPSAPLAGVGYDPQGNDERHGNV